MNTEELNKQDIQTVISCIWELSGVLMNDTLERDQKISILSAMDKLSTMLAQWERIR